METIRTRVAGLDVHRDRVVGCVRLVDGTAGTVVQTTPPSDTAAGFLAACGIDPLPRITHLHPA